MAKKKKQASPSTNQDTTRSRKRSASKKLASKKKTKATATRNSTTKKKRAVKKARSPTSKKFLPDSDIDISEARVAWLLFDVNNLSIGLTKIRHPDKTWKEIVLRLEALKKPDYVRFELGDILFKQFGRKQAKPNAKLNRLTFTNSKGSYPRKVEIALAPLRKPYVFHCKRAVVIDAKGKLVAGDAPIERPEWKSKDYDQFAKKIGALIQSEDYESLLQLLEPKLRKRKSAEKLAAEFSKWKKLPKGVTLSRTAKKNVWLQRLSCDLDGDLLPENLGRLDPDSVRAEYCIELPAQFLLDVIVVSENENLLIGKYQPHREW